MQWFCEKCLPWFLVFEHLVPSWWYSLGQFRREGLARGSMSGVGLETNSLIPFPVLSLPFLLSFSPCFLLMLEDVSSHLSAPAAMPACWLLPRLSAKMESLIPLGPWAKIYSFSHKLFLVMLFHSCNRKVIQTVCPVSPGDPPCSAFLVLGF